MASARHLDWCSPRALPLLRGDATATPLTVTTYAPGLFLFTRLLGLADCILMLSFGPFLTLGSLVTILHGVD